MDWPLPGRKRRAGCGSTEAQTLEINAKYLDVITKRAKELKAVRPELADLLDEFMLRGAPALGYTVWRFSGFSL